MCGRSVWTSMAKAQEAFRTNAFGPDITIAAEGDVRYGQSVVGIVDLGQRRYLWNFWWGFPSFRSGGDPIYNAKVEKMTTFWREPWNRRDRMIFPLDSFYEGPKYSPTRFEAPDGHVLAIAGLYAASPRGNCATMITRPASGAVVGVWGRMPVILSGDQIERWLKREDVAPEELLGDEVELVRAA
jgi:putative SOS response-associated peptidase YedK